MSSGRWSRWKHMPENTTKEREREREQEGVKEGNAFLVGGLGGGTGGEKTMWIGPWSCGLVEKQPCSQSLTPQITLRRKSKLLPRQSAPSPLRNPPPPVGNVTSSRVMWIVTFVRMMRLGGRKKKKN